MCKEFIHLKLIGMTYNEHFKRSLLLSKQLFIGSLQALIHAVYPDVFKSSTTDLLSKLGCELNHKGNIQEDSKKDKDNTKDK